MSCAAVLWPRWGRRPETGQGDVDAARAPCKPSTLFVSYYCLNSKGKYIKYDVCWKWTIQYSPIEWNPEAVRADGTHYTPSGILKYKQSQILSLFGVNTTTIFTRHHHLSHINYCHQIIIINQSLDFTYQLTVPSHSLSFTFRFTLIIISNRE